MPPTQQLVCREPQRVQVAGRPHGAELVGDQLRGHVLGRPLQEAAFLAGGPASQPEIPQFHPALGVHQQIAGLHVAVDYAVGVEKLQRTEPGRQHGPQGVQVQRFALGPLLEAALHQLEDQPTPRPHDVVDRQDVWVLKRGQQLGLSPVSGQLLGVRQELLVDLLDGDLAAQLPVAGPQHGGEIAAGDRIQDFISRREIHPAFPASVQSPITSIGRRYGGPTR
jgi:hypothetical protein